MSLHPEAIDSIVEAEPFAAVRDRYASLANEDRPGNPWEVEFDPRNKPPRYALWFAIVGALLIGMSLVASIH